MVNIFLTPLLIMFMANTHPLIMILILISTALLSSMYICFLMKNSWFGLLLSLLFIGGMLVLFLYMASLASNETISFNLKKEILFFSGLILSILVLFSLPLTMNLNHPFQNNTLLSIFHGWQNFNALFMILYLFLFLILTMEILTFFFTPMRSSK